MMMMKMMRKVYRSTMTDCYFFFVVSMMDVTIWLAAGRMNDMRHI